MGRCEGIIAGGAGEVLEEMGKSHPTMVTLCRQCAEMIECWFWSGLVWSGLTLRFCVLVIGLT